MSVLKDFEQRAIDLLLEGKLPLDTIQALKDKAQLVGYKHTGVGYFLTLSHPALPRERMVCDKPRVMGRSRGIESGFIVFIENQELVLECHSWGADAVPETYRDEDVQITAT
jgi:hypothetical protein